LPEELLMDAERQLDVLARERARVPAHLLEDVTAPDLECADRAEHEAESRPGETVVEERAEVVEELVRHVGAAVARPPAGRSAHDPLRVLGDREVARHADDTRGILDD